MNNIKSVFSIKDLENLSGVKAHTIRIWEKRYNLLQPERTQTNIRYYSLESLQKLLNISYLNNNGYKISKIASLKNNEIQDIVKDVASNDTTHSHTINTFKLAMLNFDQKLFHNTYEGLLKEKSVASVFYEDIIPLMSQIGLLWQTDTITPAQEHFISNLIRNKILIHTEKLQSKALKETQTVFVLYLPDNEVHELGLMFLNYELVSKGYQTVYLGQSVPIASLRDLLSYYDNITFISYFTVKPEKENVKGYLKAFSEELIVNNSTNLWILGSMLDKIDLTSLPKQVTSFKTIADLVKNLKKL